MQNNTKTVTINLTMPLLVLGFLFCGLKLGGVIEWSWLWVLAPFWVFPALFVAWFAVMILFFLGVCLLAAATGSPRPKITFTKK